MKSFLIHNKLTGLKNHTPYKKDVLKLIRLFMGIQGKNEFDFLRCNIAFKIFFQYEILIKNEKTAEKNFIDLIKEMYSESISIINLIKKKKKEDKYFTKKSNKEIEMSFDIHEKAGEHYSKLFKNFDRFHLFSQPATLLKKRFLRNNFDLKFFKGKKGLDIGCGNGRYTFSLKKFGIKQVLGNDISQNNINICNSIKKKYKIKNITFHKQDAMNMNYKSNSFDFVMSYGVFHHTKSMEKCLKEMIRVTKKGGKGLVFLIGEGGIRWTIIEICRIILQFTDRTYIYNYFNLHPISSKYYYLFLDHVLVQINNLKTPTQIDKIFKKLNVRNFKRWHRGSDYDEIERVFKSKFSKNKIYNLYGYGENRYIYTK